MYKLGKGNIALKGYKYDMVYEEAKAILGDSRREEEVLWMQDGIT